MIADLRQMAHAVSRGAITALEVCADTAELETTVRPTRDAAVSRADPRKQSHEMRPTNSPETTNTATL